MYITVLNLQELIEGHGYGIIDNMYFVKEKGKGKKGMEIIDGMQKIEGMLEVFDSGKVLNIIVLKHKSAWLVELNIEEDQVNVEIDEPVLLSVDTQGVTYISEEGRPLFIGTQQSFNMKKKGK
jgi:hypothetical protein